jgi:hypothetical protein
LQGPQHDAFQPFQRQRQVRAALVAQQRVDLVDDHCAHGAQHLPPAFAGQQQVQGLRGGHEDVGRRTQHALALGGRGVARAHGDTDIGSRRAALEQQIGKALQWHFQIAVNIVAQRLERGNVENTGGPRQRPFLRLLQQIVDGGVERGQRLAAAGRGRDQGVATRLDGRPGLCLRLRRRPEALQEPVAGNSMKLAQWHGRRART